MRALDAIAALVETDPAAGEIMKRAIARTGLDCYADREDALAAKIEGRMRELGVARFSDYLTLLDGARGKGEWSALIDEITVGETFFFRYPSQWDALRDTIVPDCLANNGGQPLRVLCAGCANGAEPYTLSIMATQELGVFLTKSQLSIVGFDISQSRIEQARAGVYGAWDLRAIPEHYRSCFEPKGGGWRLRDEYRRDVEFSVVNLVRDAETLAISHAGEFDIILCRNVMIYFSAETNRRLLQTFHACLKESGWFITGHAEPYLEISNVLRPHPVDGAMFYRKQARPGVIVPPSENLALQGTFAPAPVRRRAPVRKAPPPLKVLAPPPAGAPKEAIGTARRLANSGQWREASIHCETLADRDPFNPEIQFLIALIADHIGDARAVENALKRALYLDADFALAHYHLALTLAGRDDSAGAERELRNVFKCLGEAAESAPVACGDGLSAGDLRQLAHMQLRVLGGGP